MKKMSGTIVIKFKGGLGNQMFQYALYRKLQMMGKKVKVDLSIYRDENMMPFVLPEVFPEIYIDTNNAEEIVGNMLRLNKKRNILDKIFYKFVLEKKYMVREKDDGVFDEGILKCDAGILEGYWQSEKYWIDIKDDIISKFCFAPIYGENIHNFVRYLQEHETVSIHIRRGDYLLPQNEQLFGNICTDTYYKKAVKYILNKVQNATFVVFSNDEEWVRKNFKCENIIFVSDYIKYDVPDWYELYLMSQCKHNILANSSFSWWGAYLNKNNEKIVIAPSKWINKKDTKDIWPKEWIKI